MKKLHTILALLLMAVLALGACGGQPEPAPAPQQEEPAAQTEQQESAAEETVAEEEPAADSSEPVNLVWANWLGAEDAYVDDVEAMIAAFQEKYPHITVESVPYPFNQAKDQLIVTATGGNPPDISMSHPTWVAPLVEAGVLAPLDDLLLNQDDYFPGTFEGKYYDGKLMAATWAPSPIIIYYNKNLLEQAGYDGPPETWDELLQASRDIAALGTDADGNTIYGMGISSQKLTGAGYFFLPYMWNAGGEYVDADGNIVIDSPENVQAFSDVKSLFDEGVSPSGLEIRELRDLFAQGLSGFHWDGEFGVGIFAAASPKGEDFAEDYGIMLIPGDAPGEPGPTFFVEHDLVIYKDSPPPGRSRPVPRLPDRPGRHRHLQRARRR